MKKYRNIGIDATSLMYHRGVSRYTSNLITALSDTTPSRVFAYGSSLRNHSHLKKEIAKSKPHEHTVEWYPPALLSLLWRHNLHKISGVLPSIEVFHSWDWLQPPDKKIPLVSTIHDLALVKFPETAHPTILAHHRRAWDVLKKRNAQIIAVSQATKNDIVELLEIPESNVHVIHEALPLETQAVAESLTEKGYQLIKERLNLDKNFILFVGTTEPRKNIHRLIKAWQPMAKDIDLYIAGAKGWDHISEHEGLSGLRMLGRVSDQELSVLYSEAELVAYPSLYEGFGLPILEAFYHGTPVVTSDISAMPEVAGNAAELINPKSIESISEGIKNILNETAAQQQKRLQKMIIRRHAFSWRKTAKETDAVYTKAIQNHT